MNITDIIIQQSSNTLLQLKPEVRDETGNYQMFDDGGVEIQVGEFLYGLVRILQPENVLTTGIYTGISDMYIAYGLKENKHGHSTALEFEKFHVDRAERLWKNVGVQEQVTAVLINSLEYQPTLTDKYQILFLDSEPQIRFQELEKFYPFVSEGGYIGIHDLPRNLCQGNVNPDHPEMKSYPYGDLSEHIKEWIKTDKLRLIHFPSPRGLTFFYKTKESDYRV